MQLDLHQDLLEAVQAGLNSEAVLSSEVVVEAVQVVLGAEALSDCNLLCIRAHAD